MTLQNSITELFARPLQAVLDHGVDRSTTAAALCERLEGRCLAIDTGIPTLDASFTVTDGQLRFNPGAPAEADATLTGSPLNLARMAGRDPEAVIRAGHVRITGDADVATEFRALLDIVRPDWEEELSRVTGDALAHETGRAVRSFAGWAARARESLGRSVAEYLTEESRDLIARTELDEFSAGVDNASAAVDRCEARLQLLRDQRARTDKA